MKRLWMTLFAALTIIAVNAQGTAETQIRAVMDAQVQAWNAGNYEGYMQGYWNSDSLVFIGRSGITSGWRQTLENYRRSYPDKAAMGVLSFGSLRHERLSDEIYFVTGSWKIDGVKQLSGWFSLVFQKKGGSWRITHDHSS